MRLLTCVSLYPYSLLSLASGSPLTYRASNSAIRLPCSVTYHSPLPHLHFFAQPHVLRKARPTGGLRHQGSPARARLIRAVINRSIIVNLSCSLTPADTKLRRALRWSRLSNCPL